MSKPKQGFYDKVEYGSSWEPVDQTEPAAARGGDSWWDSEGQAGTPTAEGGAGEAGGRAPEGGEAAGPATEGESGPAAEGESGAASEAEASEATEASEGE